MLEQKKLVGSFLEKVREFIKYLSDLFPFQTNIGKSYYLEKWNVCPWSASIYTRQWTTLKWFYSHAWLDLSWEYRDPNRFSLDPPCQDRRSWCAFKVSSFFGNHKTWWKLTSESCKRWIRLSRCLIVLSVVLSQLVFLWIVDFKRVVLEDCMLLIYCTITRSKFVSFKQASLWGIKPAGWSISDTESETLLHIIAHHCTLLHLL